MNAWDLLPLVRGLFNERPEYGRHVAWELQRVLFSLGYVDDLADEGEIAAAEMARTDRTGEAA
jgi:hypothetical protein